MAGLISFGKGKWVISTWSCRYFPFLPDQSRCRTIKIVVVNRNKKGIGKTVVKKDVEHSVRNLTAGEIVAAKKIFENAIDYSEVKIHKCGLLGLPSKTGDAMTPNGEIYFPADDFKVDYSSDAVDCAYKIWFIHEMTHVWQYQMGYSVALQGIWLAARGGYKKGRPAYSYDPVKELDKKFQDFNMEQQAELVSHYFDAMFLENSPSNKKHFSNLSFYTKVMYDLLVNPNDKRLVPNAAHFA